MRVLVADSFEPGGREDLQRLGCQLEYRPDTTEESLGDLLAESQPDVLIVRSTRVNAQAQLRASSLKLIIRAGAGTDTIDVDNASRQGIYVANCPAKNAAAVAELAWAHLLNCDRRLVDQSFELRAGKWNKKEYSKARGLKGRTLGLVGLGTIAREVGERARGFGMTVLAWSRSLTPETASALGFSYADTPIEVARRSDAVSVHVAFTSETKHLIDRAFIEAMKDGAILVNTSRGEVVDEEALAWGIDNKGLRAGLDVYQGEPKSGVAEFTSLVTQNAKVYGTHHVGASTDQAQQAIADEAVRVVREFMTTGQVPNCVNLARRSTATCQLLVRHRNQPGVLAHVFRTLSELRINVEEMENVLYEGNAAACARIRLSKQPEPGVLDQLQRESENILGIELSKLSTEPGDSRE